MFRLLLFLSLFPIAIALMLRWWFGVRVLKTTGKRSCRCNLETWTPAPDDEALVHRAEHSAATFGQELRMKALAQWQKNEVKSAKARENTRRFGIAVPPLSGVIAIFAVVVGKVPPLGAIAIFFAATAVAASMSLLSLPAELAAITRMAKQVRQQRSFPNSEDEEAVTRCAMAHAWEASVPQFLRLL